MAKKNKKKIDESSRNDEEYKSERSVDTEENKNSKINGLKINSEKVLDQDFNSFINNEFLDISVSPSLDLSQSNIMSIKHGKYNNYLNDFNLTNKTYENINENDDINYNNANSYIQSKQMNKKNKLDVDTQSETIENNNFEKNKNKNENSEGYSTDASNNEGQKNEKKKCLNNEYQKEMSKTFVEKNGEEISRIEMGVENQSENVNGSNSMMYNKKYNNEYTNISKINDLSLPNNYLSNSIASSMITSKESELCFIKYLTVCNFKSYENENIIGPFSKFTAIIGPNGSGKSNIMDCICFVLGIDNKYLRIKNLRKLIYHKENEKIENISKRICYVKLTIESNSKETVELKRTLNYRGVSNFYINERLVNQDEYTNFLRRNRIETKTKTCLIFQGDIEEIINKKPTELSKLFEYISGSNEYEQIYEDIKERLKEKQIACKNFLNEKKKSNKK